MKKIGLLLLYGFLSMMPPAEPIRLQPEALPFVPKEFFIATVTDQRTDKGPIARLALVQNQPMQAVDLDHGLTSGLQQFLNQSLKQNKTLRPIAMRIRQFRVSETVTGNRVTGQFRLDVAFELLGKDDAGNETSTFLSDYKGGANYVRPISQTTVVESVIRQTITGALKSFNEYMNRESGQNERLAKSLRVNFVDDTRLTNDDTVNYNTSRKLTWADFKAAPRQGSHYAAEVFTSFAYEGKSSVKDGVITVNLIIKAYMLKNSSWGRADARNTYSLNHEQRHFDITKICAERFKHKLHPDSLTLDDYNSIAQYKFIETFRELNQMQTQYDDETNHSLNQEAQERWNQKIDAELRRLGIIK